jgi:cysteine sulfinate desulfinase/cysteine desulfurase-like protein
MAVPRKRGLRSGTEKRSGIVGLAAALEEAVGNMDAKHEKSFRNAVIP